MTTILVSFSGKHRCYEQKLFKFYIFTLMYIQFVSCLIQLAIMLVSGTGTIANPRPRRFIKWIIYLHTVVFAIEFIWESVGIVWVFDPILSCATSHFVLRMTRFILLWNLFISLFTALYMFLRTSLQKYFCSKKPNPSQYKTVNRGRSFGGRKLSQISIDSQRRHERRTKWHWIIQTLLCCFSFQENQRAVIREVASTLCEAFDYYRGYVASDLAAGLLLLKKKHKKQREMVLEKICCMLLIAL